MSVIAPISLATKLAEWARIVPDRPFLDGAVSMSYGEADREVRVRAERLAREASGTGPAVLAGSGDACWVIDVLACMRAALPVAIVPPAVHATERGALDTLAQPSVRINSTGDSTLCCAAARTERDAVVSWRELGVSVAFATSGTTGTPRFVLRSAASLVDEGARYRRLWQLHTDDGIVVPLTICHAYGFGAGLAATLVSGCRLILSPFRGPRPLLADARQHRATIMPLVAPMAAALATAEGEPFPRSLRIAMVGAGRPAARVSEQFAARFGITLSHNYGSSETGALLASLDPTSPECLGYPLECVECAIVADGGEIGQLWSRIQTPPLGYVTAQGFEPPRLAPRGWWASGDLFTRDRQGRHLMVGRIGDLIRRGGRAIAPREVEAALLTHPAVEDVVVRGGLDGSGEETIDAHVQIATGASVDGVALREHLSARLTPHKLPHRWHFYDRLPRTWSSKVMVRALHSGREQRPPGSALSLLTAHRFSEALLCAQNVGLIDALASGPVALDDLACRLRLDRAALDLFLSVLSSAGVVGGGPAGYRLEAPHQGWSAICTLEAQLRNRWLRAEAMSEVLRGGLSNRRFDREGADQAFADAYVGALCGPSQNAVADLLARTLPLARGFSILEIGRAIGKVPVALSERIGGIDVDLIALAPPPALVWRDCRTRGAGGPISVCTWDELALPANCYDLVLLTNCIHWLPPGTLDDALSTIAASLRAGGTVAIADVFLADADRPGAGEEPAQRFLLDWMTHGGTHWLHARGLTDALSRSGLSDPRVRRFGALSHHVIVARAQSIRPQAAMADVEPIFSEASV